MKSLPVLALVLSLGLLPLPVMAGGRGGGGGTYNRGGGFQMNIRQMALGRLQQSVGFTDDEWGVVEPKLWHVASLQLALGKGSMARISTMLQRFAARGNQNGADPMAQITSQEDANVAEMTTEYEQLGQQLQALENDQASSDQEIEAKLTAYRAARGKLEDSLAAAQKDLQSVLTLREESLLLLDGYLD